MTQLQTATTHDRQIDHHLRKVIDRWENEGGAPCPVERAAATRHAYFFTRRQHEENTTMTRIPARPPIVIGAEDFERLDRLASRGLRMRPHPPTAKLLADELDRATIVEPHEVGPTTVAMRSGLTYRDDVTDEIRRVTLVYPGEEDSALGRVSVFTPIGAAMIGLSEGQSIDWRTATGGWRRLTVLKVHAQPPARRIAASISGAAAAG